MESINVQHKKIQIRGLKKRYTFLHITDTHVVCFGKDESITRIEYAKPRKALFSKNGITPDVRLRAYIDYANSVGVSGVLLTGDIIDFPSPENLDVLKESLAALRVPYIYVAGNHDWSYFDNYQTRDSVLRERPLLRPFCGGDEDFHAMRIGELTFAALDNTMDVYRPGTADRLKEVLDTVENVIILQHAPLYCDTLHADTVKGWKKDITLGGLGIAPDDSAEKIRKLLTSSPSAKAILCGHLHFSHEDLIDGVLPQYVTPLSSYGDVTLFEISG